MKSGEVRAVIRDKGYGFIRDSSGVDFFFHVTGLEIPFEDLHTGDQVLFESEQGPKGFRAVEVRPV